MEASAVFPGARPRSGMYESFYLRAVSPLEPVGVWIRYTVHKRPGHPPRRVAVVHGLRRRARRSVHAQDHVAATRECPSGGWIEIDGQATLGPDGAKGTCGPASWSLRFGSNEADLRHLRPEWLYRAPLPRTKLTSPAPLARFDGILELPGPAAARARGWPGMIGHNWGSRACRALDLAARLPVRRRSRTHGWTSRPGAC